jgi:hypothetical protein
LEHYGNASDRVEPLAFVGVIAAAIVLAAFGDGVFECRDLAA